MARRILILYASVGGGHGRAAAALEEAFGSASPDSLVRRVDVLELTNAPFRRIYGKAYFDLFRFSPHLIGYLYDVMDRPRRGKGAPVGERLRAMVERANLRRVSSLLLDEPWDLVVHTHFLPAAIVSFLRRKGSLSVPHAIAVTDFDVHRLWINQPCERYFTATEEAAAALRALGVPPGDVDPAGIPVSPMFAREKGRAASRAKFGLPMDRPVILQMAGGFGVGPVETVFRSLLSVEKPLALVAVTGSDARVRESLSKIAVPERHAANVLGFTKEIDELMEAADLLVSKPGGLTSSEALVKGLPMVIVNPIPGQESRNSDFLLEAGAAVKANNLPVLGMKVEALLRDPDRMVRMREDARRAARPQAASRIAESCLKLLLGG
jgi:processive 1,2-diacylglycerol beta-glucosyltransferase